MGSNLRMQAAAVAVGSAATLGAALAFQHLGGLAPCELCYWQRYPYWGAIPLAILGTVLPGRAGALCLAGAAICLATTAGIGGFHVGVEQHWWQGTSACGSAQGPAASLEELRARLLAAPIVRCDSPAWTLAGLSMAAYNMLIATALGLTAGWTALKRWKGDVQ
jgi:disulfide bond formation protein DsbB